MIDRLAGKLVAKSPASAIIEVGGVSFAVSVPLSTGEKLGAVGSEVRLYTHLHVREDALSLFGFGTLPERETFLQLIAVSGVGPKLALAILSRFAPDALAGIISDQDVRRFQTVPGVGKRTAERLMVELKGRFRSVSEDNRPIQQNSSAASEAVRALETLGFTILQADEAVRKAQNSLDSNATTEDLIRIALRG